MATSTRATRMPAAKSAPATPGKLRWQFPEGFAGRMKTRQNATAADSTVYTIAPVDGGKWSTTVGKLSAKSAVVIVTAVAHGTAYAAAVKASKGVVKAAA